MIKIHSINDDGAITTRLWDIFTCKFFDEDGNKIDTNIEVTDDDRESFRKNDDVVGSYCCDVGDKGEDIKEFADRLRNKLTIGKTYLTKSKDIASIRVQMGMKCNYSCQYCKQTLHHNQDAHADIDDAKNFIANFDNIFTTDSREPINIQLWGGEPLMYWSILTLLGEFFRARFPYARITCLSNGSLVDEEKINWFLKHKVILAVSHDGPGQMDYRSGDCLKEGSESLKWLCYYSEHATEPLYFNAVITKNRYNLPEIVKYITSKITGKCKVGFEGIVLVEDIGQFDDATMFEEKDYLLLRKTVLKQLLDGELNNVGIFSDKVNQLMSSMVNPQFKINYTAQQKCGMDSPYHISVDLKGNILACHSTPKHIGHVDKFEEASLEKINFIHWSKREECNNCPVLPMCRGGCLAQDPSAHYYSCNNEFHYNLIFFEAVFHLFFGETIIGMEGVVRPTMNDFLKMYTE